MVAVRDSRYTFELIEKADDFTVTIPADETYKDEVMFCGTKSGRDYDKFEHCNLRQKQAIHVDSPVIDIPGIGITELLPGNQPFAGNPATRLSQIFTKFIAILKFSLQRRVRSKRPFLDGHKLTVLSL